MLQHSTLYTWQGDVGKCRKASFSPAASLRVSALHCCTLYCSAIQCSTIQCSTVQCSAVQCSAVQFSVMQCGAVSVSLGRQDAGDTVIGLCQAAARNYHSIRFTYGRQPDLGPHNSVSWREGGAENKEVLKKIASSRSKSSPQVLLL